jgi:hypothetical protein
MDEDSKRQTLNIKNAIQFILKVESKKGTDSSKTYNRREAGVEKVRGDNFFIGPVNDYLYLQAISKPQISLGSAAIKLMTFLLQRH